MIELIVLGSIQGVVWGGIGVYKAIKAWKKRRNRNSGHSDQDDQEVVPSQRRQRPDRIRIPRDALPKYELYSPTDSLPPSYFEVPSPYVTSPSSPNSVTPPSYQQAIVC